MRQRQEVQAVSRSDRIMAEAARFKRAASFYPVLCW
ncbi:hypothetical protein ParKJ_31355 [Paraburkholderia fungorum]|uniref:Uncharacterized protein n=1 Tax=Paraburkholderia fungorum TaxID=134537 RepID=A0AAP5UZB9_9BURK|nr:hypothetical protein [Paraburkholderia fungorum]